MATENKTRRLLGALFGAMREGVCLHRVIFDDEGRAVDYFITDVNPAYEEIVGIDRDDAVGKLATELYGSDDPPYLDIFAGVAETGDPHNFETYFPPMEKHFSISVISAVPGTFATIFFDITDQKRAEAILRDHARELEVKVKERTLELRETLDAYERSNAELDRYASALSHDLREPLRTVSGFLQILKERASGQLDEAGHSLVNDALQGAQHMGRLVSDLYAYARVRAPDIPKEPVDCGAIFDAAVERLGAAVQETSAEVSREEMPVVHADPVQLGVLFQNLVGNALKFRGKASPRVRVSASREGDSWLIRVRDNGVGVSPEHTHRLFDLFYRGLRSSGVDGTGMGLALCKKVVEAHGGRIWAEPGDDQGSVFSFTLPSAA
jgi:signal transduction histidine kinase